MAYDQLWFADYFPENYLGDGYWPPTDESGVITSAGALVLSPIEIDGASAQELPIINSGSGGWFNPIRPLKTEPELVFIDSIAALTLQAVTVAGESGLEIAARGVITAALPVSISSVSATEILSHANLPLTALEISASGDCIPIVELADDEIYALMQLAA